VNTEVAESIIRRARERADGQLRAETVKTALVVQGGTLRSVASCGSAAALNSLNLTNAFDTVYGSSSGAVNAAYFLARQAALGVTVYTEDVNNKRFLNFLRVGKMMDLEFFFNEIVKGRKKHNFEAFVQHPTELKILAADRDTAETVWFSSKDASIDIYDAMKASCALPVVYGRTVRVGGRNCIDGFIKEPMPLLTALGSDYTDILVLMTRHISSRQTGHVGILRRLFVEPLLRRELGPELYTLLRNRWKQYNSAVDLIEAGVYEREDGHRVRIAYVCPDLEAEADKYDFDSGKLAEAAYSSWKNAFALFRVQTGAERESFDAAMTDAKERCTSYSTTDRELSDRENSRAER
jgi:predicted patatin/cPLA2 family phospholipase